MDRIGRKSAIALLALAPILILWRALFLGEVIGPFDQINSMAPWNVPASGTWDVLQADGALQFYGWRDLVFEAWQKGGLPLWNPYQLGGTPLLANSQSAGFYPLHALLGVLHVPTPFAMALLAWFHLAWAGLGVFWLSRKLGASRLGSTIGGLAFSLSPFMVGWTALPSVITTVSWVPWALWGTLTLVGEGPSAKRIARTAACVGMMLLAGHLQFAAYGMIACTLAAIWAFLLGNRDESFTVLPGARLPVAGFGGWVAATALGGMLAAPQVLPALEYSKFSHRANKPSEAGYGAYISGALRPFELVSIPTPGLLGNPSQPSAALEGLSTYWPAVVKAGGHFAESAIGIGPLVVLLLFAVPYRSSRRKELGFFLTLAAIALLLALGSPLNRALYFSVPGWSSTGSPARASFLFVLSLCVVAPLAIGETIPKGRGWVKPLALGAVAFAAAIQVPLTFQVQSWIPALNPEMKRYMASTLQSAGPGALLGVALAIVGLLGAVTQHKHAWVATVAAAILAPMAMYAGTLVRTAPSLPARLPEIGANERIAAINGPWELLARAPAVLPPNTASLSRVMDLGGYDSLLHRDTVNLLRDIDGDDPAPAANGNMMFIKPTADPAKLMEAGVTQVWTTRVVPRFDAFPYEDGPAMRVYKLPGAGVASVGGVAVPDAWLRLDLRGCALAVEGPGELVVKFVRMPGWRVMVDGAPAEMTPGRWLSVRLPEGTHTVEFAYTPPGLVPGVVAAVVAVLVLGVGLLVSRRGRRQRD